MLAVAKLKRLRCRGCRGYAFQVGLLYYHKVPDNGVPLRRIAALQIAEAEYARL